ncbi:hypothetical protein HMPREF0044_0993 [Gleimia coleocanis DSM 15436]|uniref:Uncharacterized protein n=1 Tax=Gleimia coleocanis DSM 15436 TaxID=525245 RepID=C0W0B5_9ACTO|nr:hypothetical protein [Gleimia coleocanis]EEH63974.1 hypothetical protein HMPREF0044_0993 [Gleimia coleocanis DSM 15436]
MIDTPMASSAKQYRTLDPGYIRTEVLQRRYTKRTPWWRDAVINEIPGIIDEEGARLLEDCVFFIARMGFTAVTFRPASIDLEKDCSILRSLIEAIHRVGLKAIVRIAGAEYRDWGPAAEFSAFYGFERDADTIIKRAKIALKNGADGIDLGRIEDTPEASDEVERAVSFTQLTRVLLAELAEYSEDHILTAEASIFNTEAYRRHFEEEWLHLLCDDRLQRVGFNASQIETQIREKIQAHERQGSVCSWQATLPRLNTALGTENFFLGSWEENANEFRRAALRMLVAALPGSVFLPFGFSGGHLDFEGAHIRPYPPQSEVEKERVAHTTMVLRLRAQHQLATCAFGIVKNLPWANPGCLALTCGPLMAVLNTGDTAVEVPSEHELLLRSESTKQEDSPISKVIFGGQELTVTHSNQGSSTVIPAGACAWFLC